VLLDLRERFEVMGRRSNPFDDGETPIGAGVHWVRPELVAEITFAEWA
jgi:bifunctional non-homologous end joining protein LigD